MALIPSKVRSKGWGWLLRRMAEEGLSPYYALRRLHRYLRRMLARKLIFAELRSENNDTSDRTLFAVYDLDVYPISYDVLWFLVWADLRRRRDGLEMLQCVFVPISDQSKRVFPPGYDAVVDQNSREWRFRNICLAALELVPDAGGPMVCGSRGQLDALRLFAKRSLPKTAGLTPPPPLAQIYRETSRALAESPGQGGLRASVQGTRYIRGWLEQTTRGRRPVVITLRQYGVDAQRNSSLEDWASFVRQLDARRYCAAIVPDTDHSFEPHDQFGNAVICREASWNLGLRMALYEAAFVNMFVNCGPGSLCILNRRCRYLFFKITVPGVELASAETLRFMGFMPGETPSFASRFQRWVWEDDRVEVLQREFNALAGRIEAEEPARGRADAELQYGAG